MQAVSRQRLGKYAVLAVVALCAFVVAGPVSAQLTYNEVKQRGAIRFLLREAAPSEVMGKTAMGLARRFADRLGVKPQWVYRPTQKELVDALAAGDGDVIIEPMVLGIERPKGIVPTLPLAETSAWVIASPFLKSVRTFGALTDDAIAVPFGSDLWRMMLDARQKHPEIALAVASSQPPTSSLVASVAAGQRPYAVVFEDEIEAQSNARRAFPLKSDVPMGWLMRTDDRVLRAHADNFIQIHALTQDFDVRGDGDWEAIKARGTLRLVTLNRPDTYFTAAGEFYGFEYEMVRRFARKHDLALEVVIAPHEDQLIPILLQGRGDLAAGFITPTASLRAQGVSFSTPYHASEGQLVGRRNERRPLHPVDLHRARIAVSQSSPYLDHLTSIRNAGVSFDIHLLPQGTEDSLIMEGVRSGQFQYGVADRFLVSVDTAIEGNLVGAMTIGDAEPHAWAVRLAHQNLLSRLNAFWNQTYQSSAHRRTHYKYFAQGGEAQPYKSEFTFLRDKGQISPYDDLVQRFARYYDFDWRLILALMYEESRFDPEAVSSAGARGLMQVKDVAAEEVGIADISDPQDAIHAGVKYLDWVRAHLESDLDVRDRIWFSLVGYNAGIARLLDARTLAAQMNLDTRRWQGQVELAFQELPQSGMRDGKHVTLQPQTTISYIERIQARYQAYVRLTNSRDAARARITHRERVLDAAAAAALE